MPFYDFRCKECDTTFPVVCRISEKDEPKYCPNCESKNTEQVILSAPGVGDVVRLGVRTIDNGFREVLSKVSEKTYRSNLKDKLSR